MNEDDVVTSRHLEGIVHSVRRFGPFELDLRSGELRREGELVRIQPQPFRALALLVERPGELVTREELTRALWGDATHVDFDRGLNFCINQVRTALGDSAESPEFIQTLPRRGYRFIARVGPGSDQGRTLIGSGSDQGRTRVETGSDPGPTPNRPPFGEWAAGGAGVLLLAAVIAGAAFIANRTAKPAAGPPERVMIAVLPFDDLSGDASLSWFADGLTDELIAQLGRVSPQRLGVIARTSTMTYRNSTKSVLDIGRELSVSHVLEGSLRREGDRQRVTVRLVAVANQAPVWSETYDRSGNAALTIQSEVATQVTRALALELLPAAWATTPWSGTRNPEAWDAFLRGKYYLNRAGPADLRIALTQLEDAARLDPSFAAAYAAQADTHHLMAMFGLTPPAAAYAEARTAAAEAIRHDTDLADGHAAAGLVALWGDWNPTAAAVSFERALSLNPSHAGAHHDYAWALVALERFDEAAAHIRRARDLNPLSPRASNDIGWLYLQIRQPSEAMRACRQTLALEPESVEAQQCLERAHLQRGEITDALAAANAAATRRGGPLPAILNSATAPQERLLALWRWRVQQLDAASTRRYVNPYTIAMHYVVLGDRDRALERLEEAYHTRVAMMVLLRTDPIFEPLRDESRFRQLLGRIR